MSKIVNDIKRGKIANFISLHDFAIDRPDFKKWLEYVVEFFHKYNITPNRLGGHNRTGTKNITFKNGVKKLEANNYDTDLIWVAALPNGETHDTFDPIFSTRIFIEKEESNDQCCHYCNLVFDDDIVPFNIEEINQLIKDLASISTAKYGYVFQREFTKVVGYDRGIISGLERGEPEREFINKWGLLHCPGGTYKTGDLRDIYPINMLCGVHLNRIINGQRFEEWIKAKPYRGILEQLGADCWSWQVEFKQISTVREELRPTGMVLCI